MSDLLDRLQDMVDVKHDDMDVAREAIEEITRLRAALATARLEGMEEVERHFRIAAAGTPLGYEDHQRGASVYNWLMYCATTIATIRAAAKEDRPSEEIIREDRDAWPDRQQPSVR